mgnify:CR=1 FL=1
MLNILSRLVGVVSLRLQSTMDTFETGIRREVPLILPLREGITMSMDLDAPVVCGIIAL